MSGDIFVLAPEGQVYVCAACGKTSRNRAGWIEGGGDRVAQPGWDESCFMNAVLCFQRLDASVPWVAVREKT